MTMEEKRSDLKVSGVGSAPGGHYCQATIEGVCKVKGDIKSDQTFRANGIVTIMGDVQAQELDCDGKMKVEGHLSARKSELDGIVNVMGAVDGVDMKLNGILHVGGDMEMERFEAYGGFDIGGLLNADKIDVRLNGRGKAREIGCEAIRIRKTRKNVWAALWFKMIPKWNLELTSELIEGEEVDLEDTTAAIVRGDRVVIGPGCRIGTVEYRSELIKHPKAQIGKELKFGEGSSLA